MKKIYFTLINLLFALAILAQTEGNNLVKYTPQFRFKDGIYLKFADVKKNSPTSKERIVTNVDPKDFDFFDKVLANKTISTYDALGQLNTIKVKDIWGFSHNGVLYINANEEFNRIPIFGSICHFVANKTVLHATQNNPTNMYGTRYNSNNYNRSQTSYTTKEMTQYILVFETGKLLEYDSKSVSVALMADPELHDAFEQLSSRKKEKKKFFYIRKFNQRNPLYLPLH